MSNGGVDGAYIQTSVYGGDLGTWTHAWFVWKGTGNASGNTFEVPCHVAYQWGDDGKIAQTWFFSDQSNHLKEFNKKHQRKKILFTLSIFLFFCLCLQ